MRDHPSDKNGTEASPHASVPAVERAVAILHFIQALSDPNEATVSNIARQLDLNKSTCSNILRTLSATGLIEYNASSKAYGLGVGLIGLGTKASQRRQFPSVGIPYMESLVRQTGFTCVAFEQLPNGEFIIVAKVESPRDIKVTIDVGQHFPPGAPVFARVALAWRPPAEAEAHIARWGLPSYTQSTIVDRQSLYQELDRIRREGVAISRGEYYLANTAIAAPVFSAQRDVSRGICLVAFSSEISDAEVPTFCEKLRTASHAISVALGGSPL